MDIFESTRLYEEWLRSELRIVDTDLALKHERMAEDPYTFLRGTFYRWMQVWQETFTDDTEKLNILSVGDLHASNYGTWRDLQSNLVWGINDFDEAYALPYTLDLTRLAVSVRLASAIHVLKIHPDDACKSILEGYRDCLETGGRPLVLDNEIKWLKKAYFDSGIPDDKYWDKLDALPDHEGELPAQARATLEAALPEAGLPCRLKHRQAGIGSLGRPRYTALAIWQGKRIAREVKSLLPSAAAWAEGKSSGAQIQYSAVLERAIRASDPVVAVHHNWIARRLSPDSRRIDLTELNPGRDEERMMYAMGWETGNIHLGTPHATSAIRDDLKKRKKNWLDESSKLMARITWNDWEAWQKK